MGKYIIIKILGAVVSALNVAVPLIFDAQSIFPKWPWQYHALIGFIFFALFMVWIAYDLNKKLQNILSAKPRLIFKRIQHIKNIMKGNQQGNTFIPYGQPEFVRIWVANEPLLQEEGVDAELLHGEIAYYKQGSELPLFTMGGRWPEQGQPVGSLLSQQLTIPPNRKEFCMDIGMKYREDDEYYGYDDDAHNRLDGRNPKTKLDRGEYFVKVTLACRRLFQPLYFRLENQGKGHDINFEAISESDFRKAGFQP